MKSLSIILLTVLSVHSFSVSAQNKKCKFETDIVDPIDGKKIIVTEFRSYNKDYGGVRMKLNDTLISVFVSKIFSTDTPKPFAIEKGAELIFLLENKDTIKTYAQETKVGPSGHANFSQMTGETKYFTSIENDYPLNKDQLSRLKSSPLKLIRLTAKLPNEQVKALDCPIFEKQKSVIIDLINCIETRL